MEGLSRLNDWVMEFCSFNHLSMNPRKTQMVGRERDGSNMTNSSILVSGALVAPINLLDSVMYLGVWISMSLKTTKQNQAISQVIGYHCHLARSHRLRPEQAVTFFNTYLAPKVEYKIRYAKPSAATVRRWDALLTKTMSALSHSHFCFKTESLAVFMGLILPSQLEAVAKVSEAFLRLNGSSEASATGRTRMGSTQSEGPLRNRLTRAGQLAEEVLSWEFSVVDKRHQFRQELSAPVSRQHVTSSTTFVDQLPCRLVFNHWGTWGASSSRRAVTIFTDGSAAGPLQPPGSSWAICVQNDWLTENFGGLPGEDSLEEHHLRGASLHGTYIDLSFSKGIYLAELQAIYQALSAVPVGWDLTIVTDSLSSLMAIHSFTHHANERRRRRLRMMGRPLLAMIEQLAKCRSQAGGSLSIQHVRAHGVADSVDAAGNMCADFKARKAREVGDVDPACKEPPLAQGERWIALLRMDPSLR
jgi:hypothetical protein